MYRGAASYLLLFLIIFNVNVKAEDHQNLLQESWEAYKQRFMFCGENCGNDMGMVFDPYHNYHTTSESSGYGLLIAVMMNDQATFDIIYDATYKYLYDPNMELFHWRADNSGKITGSGSASDADIDIAAALIFAHRREQRGEWQQHPTRPYGDTANALINAIYRYDVVDGIYLKPGNQFGGTGIEIINLSYFSPAWLQLFDEHQGTKRWQPVIDQGYLSLLSTPGASFGLAPDWSTVDGNQAFAFCEQENRPLELCGFEMRYDAIRVPWRQAVHCLWNGDPRACNWSIRTTAFLRTLPRPSEQARFFNMNGSPVVDYQDTVMRSMWSTAALAAGDIQLNQELIRDIHWTPSTDNRPGYWGIEHNDYYQQSLAWFAISLVNGEFQMIE